MVLGAFFLKLETVKRRAKIYRLSAYHYTQITLRESAAQS